MNLPVNGAVVCVALALLVSGCSGGPKMYPVNGTVKFTDGTPLNTGSVTLDSGTISGHGDIGSDGTFTIVDGLPTGDYKITLGGNALGSYDNPKPLVNQKYSGYETTDLEQKVGTGENNFEITVEKP